MFFKITGEERCKLFFCDPYVSNQKINVENINKRLRKFSLKEKSVDYLLKKNIILLDTSIKSLDGNTQKEVFKAVYGEVFYFTT
jgi:IS30 family transposase